MVRTLLASVVVAALPFTAFAESSLARFEHGIGSHPNATALGTPAGGQPWVIASLSVDVKTDGRISAAGRGLLLGGGNNIGRTGGQSVRARLFCNVGQANVAQTTHESDAVALEPDGDFRIDGSVTPPPPAGCANPALLIVNVPAPTPANPNPTPAWFAAGIEKF